MKLKCVFIFVFGMSISLMGFAFFQQMMTAPQKLMMMPQQMVCPPCNCQTK